MARPKKDKGLTPMLQQYCDIKAHHQDCLLFFRLGDFYELFFEDAKVASAELGLVLTARAGTPMCGVPHFAVDSHIATLIGRGFRVAICEQVGDPAQPGLVEREVVRIVTPGTVTDAAMLDESANNFLMALAAEDDVAGIACADLSTGCLELVQVSNSAAALRQQIAAYHPPEILTDEEGLSAMEALRRSDYQAEYQFRQYDLTTFDLTHATRRLCEHYQVQSLHGLDIEDAPVAVRAAGALLHYLQHTQKHALPHLRRPRLLRDRENLVLSDTASRNLEILRSLSGNKRGSLLGLLDHTKTAMGARLLRRNLERPLGNRDAIQARLDAVEELTLAPETLFNLRNTLAAIRDIERLGGRLSLGSITPRECLALGVSLAGLPALKEQLAIGSHAPLLLHLAQNTDALADVRDRIAAAIHPKATNNLAEGGVINDGFDAEIDRLRASSQQGKDWIADMETAERVRTGIKNLKIGYNRVFGYYIEVTKSNLDLVPYEYTRKQTLAGCERYITDQLKAIEDDVLSAQERLVQLETAAYAALKESLCQHIRRLQATADAVANIDLLCALADCALEYDYVKPTLLPGRDIDIRKGRHPVVERGLCGEVFVPNDALLSDTEARMSIITGPNMSGKSTYLRQIALIVLMTHIGSFVPAASAAIGRVDRIFTRIGASDDIACGRSTFMVEMSEMSAILNGATPDSLIILDEIGRGTSTFDGLSIARAVVEFLCQGQTGPRTLFSTHYHELSQLENTIPGVKNYRVSVKELGDDVLFLRSILPGGSDKSFGIHVAKISGMPEAVWRRAQEILQELEAQREAALPDVQAVQKPSAQAADAAADAELVRRL